MDVQAQCLLQAPSDNVPLATALLFRCDISIISIFTCLSATSHFSLTCDVNKWLCRSPLPSRVDAVEKRFRPLRAILGVIATKGKKPVWWCSSGDAKAYRYLARLQLPLSDAWKCRQADNALKYFCCCFFRSSCRHQSADTVGNYLQSLRQLA